MEGGVMSINGFPRISIFHLSNQFLPPTITITKPICHRPITNSASAFATPIAVNTTPSTFSFLQLQTERTRTRRSAGEAALLDLQNSLNLVDALTRSGEIVKVHALNILSCEFWRFKWYTEPSQAMLITLLKVYAIAGLFEKSRQILSELEASGYAGDEMPYFLFMDALSKSRKIAEANILIDEMHRRWVQSVVGRSGRTLWNVLANIAGFLCGPSVAESHRLIVKSGGLNSSCDSPSSKAWFSGHDSDEVQVVSMGSATSSTIPEPSSTDQILLIRTSIQSLTADNAPSSSSGGISGKTILELNVDDWSLQACTSVDWSQIVAGIFRRSYRRCYATAGLQEDRKKAVGSVRRDHINDDIDSTPCEFSGPGDNVAKVKQRKLLYSKQVVRERFKEQEEAYRMESDQQKMDEIFMREALQEAKKAADMWEVPVGAVLVQESKIIARGYNLVEDMRDSTAHAEMICIREASNVLKAWRLLDTTLYVTLEPCPMCAGAILQARIGALVYGAPNKLLGADGSWIRLLPSSIDEESRGKPPAHPFHQNMRIRRGILEAECADAMQQFFRLRRKRDKKN